MKRACHSTRKLRAGFYHWLRVGGSLGILAGTNHLAQAQESYLDHLDYYAEKVAKRGGPFATACDMPSDRHTHCVVHHNDLRGDYKRASKRMGKYCNSSGGEWVRDGLGAVEDDAARFGSWFAEIRALQSYASNEGRRQSRVFQLLEASPRHGQGHFSCLEEGEPAWSLYVRPGSDKSYSCHNDYPVTCLANARYGQDVLISEHHLDEQIAGQGASSTSSKDAATLRANLEAAAGIAESFLRDHKSVTRFTGDPEAAVQRCELSTSDADLRTWCVPFAWKNIDHHEGVQRARQHMETTLASREPSEALRWSTSYALPNLAQSALDRGADPNHRLTVSASEPYTTPFNKAAYVYASRPESEERKKTFLALKGAGGRADRSRMSADPLFNYPKMVERGLRTVMTEVLTPTMADLERAGATKAVGWLNGDPYVADPSEVVREYLLTDPVATADIRRMDDREAARQAKEKRAALDAAKAATVEGIFVCREGGGLVGKEMQVRAFVEEARGDAMRVGVSAVKPLTYSSRNETSVTIDDVNFSTGASVWVDREGWSPC